MSIVTIKITFVTVLLAVFAAFFAISTVDAQAAYESHYLATGGSNASAKAKHDASQPKLSIPFGSDEVADTDAHQNATVYSFFSLSTTGPVALPKTAGVVETDTVACQIQSSFNRVLSIHMTLVDCADANGTVAK